MKINLPITTQEKLFPPDKTLVSKTDAQGIITFVNRDFVEVCGFSESELVGANHNIIRHPDMPAPAFEIMWKTLQRGLPWSIRATWSLLYCAPGGTTSVRSSGLALLWSRRNNSAWASRFMMSQLWQYRHASMNPALIKYS